LFKISACLGEKSETFGNAHIEIAYLERYSVAA